MKHECRLACRNVTHNGQTWFHCDACGEPTNTNHPCACWELDEQGILRRKP